MNSEEDTKNPLDQLYLAWALQIGCLMEERYPCRRCGNCCRQDEIVLMDTDVNPIVLKFGIPIQDFRRTYLRRYKGHWYLKESDPCQFLAEDGVTCTIYSVRPTVCKQFPYRTRWFIKGIYDLLKFGPKECPPMVLDMGDEWPCREEMKVRIRHVVDDFLADPSKYRQSSANRQA